MNTIRRRLSKLETIITPQVEPWRWERLEAGRKRVAAARRDSVGMDSHSPLPAGCVVVERLEAGRARVHEIWKQKLLRAKD
jgi:hypothetical protein